MGVGLQNGTQTTTPQLTGSQQNLLGNQTNAYLSTFLPAYQQAIQGATNTYNNNIGGVTQAGQNLVTQAGQAQGVLGSTGQQALQTGIAGLANLFGPQYEQQQINAALTPAQYQYQQNLANLSAGFGGAGQLGSAREALASQNLASTNAMNQASIIAGIQNQIANQRLNAGQSLAQLGQAGLTQGIGAANAAIAGSQLPISTYNQYLSGLAAVPGATPNFSGTIGSLVNNKVTTGNATPQGIIQGIGAAGTIAGSLGNVISGITGGNAASGIGNAISSGAGAIASGAGSLANSIFGGSSWAPNPDDVAGQGQTTVAIDTEGMDLGDIVEGTGLNGGAGAGQILGLDGGIYTDPTYGTATEGLMTDTEVTDWSNFF